MQEETMARESSTTDPTAVVEPRVAADPATSEPPAYVAPPPADPPTYAPVPSAAPPPGRTSAPVGWVIAAMLLFWPTGIPALLASHRSARAFGAGATDVALQEAAGARRWSIVSVVVGALLILVSLLSAIAWAVVVAVAVHDHHDGELGIGPGFSNELPFGDGPERSDRRGFAG
jgi:hypothetical protein